MRGGINYIAFYTAPSAGGAIGTLAFSGSKIAGLNIKGHVNKKNLVVTVDQNINNKTFAQFLMDNLSATTTDSGEDEVYVDGTKETNSTGEIPKLIAHVYTGKDGTDVQVYSGAVLFTENVGDHDVKANTNQHRKFEIKFVVWNGGNAVTGIKATYNSTYVDTSGTPTGIAAPLDSLAVGAYAVEKWVKAAA